MTPLKWDGTDLLLDCWLQPNAQHSGFCGLHDGAIKIRIAAPPREGAANSALLRFLADQFGLPPSRLQLEKGHGSRRKRVRICQPGALPDWLDRLIADTEPRL